MWYLSFARHHLEQLKQESSSFLNSLTDAADYSDVSNESDTETDSDDDNLFYIFKMSKYDSLMSSNYCILSFLVS